jgi:hypothetical protein
VSPELRRQYESLLLAQVEQVRIRARLARWLLVLLSVRRFGCLIAGVNSSPVCTHDTHQ